MPILIHEHSSILSALIWFTHQNIANHIICMWTERKRCIHRYLSCFNCEGLEANSSDGLLTNSTARNIRSKHKLEFTFHSFGTETLNMQLSAHIRPASTICFIDKATVQKVIKVSAARVQWIEYPKEFSAFKSNAVHLFFITCVCNVCVIVSSVTSIRSLSVSKEP